MIVYALQVLSCLVGYVVESNDESMALLGVSLMQQLAQSAIGQLDDEGWQYVVDAFQQGCSFESLASLLSNQQSRWAGDHRLYGCCLLSQ